MAELEELFGEGEGAPKARSRRIWALLVTGILLAILGLACSAAPGGILVLTAWMMAEREMDRIENGYLSPDQRPAVARLRNACYAGLVLVVIVFVAQGWLFCGGFYHWLWEEALMWMYGVDPTAAPPPIP